MIIKWQHGRRCIGKWAPVQTSSPAAMANYDVGGHDIVYRWPQRSFFSQNILVTDVYWNIYTSQKKSPLNLKLKKSLPSSEIWEIPSYPPVSIYIL